MPSLSETEMRAVFATQDHWVEATVKTAGQRLLELFQGANSDYLMLRDATMTVRAGDYQPIQMPDCVLLKSQVVFAFPASDRHESPNRRWNTFVGKNQYAAFLMLPGYSISGLLHLKGTSDSIQALTQELGNFLPVTQASIRPAAQQRAPLDVNTALVNKAFVSFFSIGKQVSNTGAVEIPATAQEPSTRECEYEAKELEIRKLIAELQKLIAVPHSPETQSRSIEAGQFTRDNALAF
jgi:hypothetical protein